MKSAAWRPRRRLAAALATAVLATASSIALPLGAQQALSPAQAAERCAQPAPGDDDWLERCVAFDVTGARSSAKMLIAPCRDDAGKDLEDCLEGRIAAYVARHPVGTMPVQIAPPTPKPRPTAAPTPKPAPPEAPAAPLDLRVLTLGAVVLAFAAGLGLGLSLRKPPRP